MDRLGKIVCFWLCVTVCELLAQSPCVFVSLDVLDSNPFAAEYERAYLCANGRMSKIFVTNRVARLRLRNITVASSELLARFANDQEDLRFYEVIDAVLSPANSTATNMYMNFHGVVAVNVERISLVNVGCAQSQCALTVSATWLPNLRSLTLKQVNLAALALRGLPSLSVLELRECGLTSFDSKSVDLVTARAPLSFLYLAGNRIRSISIPDSWLERLRVLDLSENDLQPLSFVQLFGNSSSRGAEMQLKDVRANRNRLVDEDAQALANVTKLVEILDLSENSLTGAFSLPTCYWLTHLNLSGNSITQVPAIGASSLGCESLYTLDLSHNRLRRLDPLVCGDDSSGGVEFCKYRFLRRFLAAYNQIETVDEAFVLSIGSSTFEELDLRGNRLVTFPAEQHLVSPLIVDEPCAVRSVLLEDNQALAVSGLVSYTYCEPDYVTSTSIASTSDTVTLFTDEPTTSTSTSVPTSESTSTAADSISELTSAETLVTSSSGNIDTLVVGNVSDTVTIVNDYGSGGDELAGWSVDVSTVSVTIPTDVSLLVSLSVSNESTSTDSQDSSTWNSTNSTTETAMATVTALNTSFTSSTSGLEVEATDSSIVETTTSASVSTLAESIALETDLLVLNVNSQKHAHSNPDVIVNASVSMSTIARNEDLLFTICVTLFCCLLLSLFVILVLAVRLCKSTRRVRILTFASSTSEKSTMSGSDKSWRPKPYAYEQLVVGNNSSLVGADQPTCIVPVDNCSLDMNGSRRSTRLSRNHSDPSKKCNGHETDESSRVGPLVVSRVIIQRDELQYAEQYVTNNKLLGKSNLSVHSILLGLPADAECDGKKSRAESDVELCSTVHRYPSEFWELNNDKTETDL